MRDNNMWLVDAPPLTPEEASVVLEFLYEFINAYENQYADTLRCSHRKADELTRDLFAEFDDELP